MPVRLQKFLSQAGIASRRASEQIILSGRVSVNGETVSELGRTVEETRDEITVDGVRVRSKKKLYLALHKPPGYLCTRRDTLGRKCVGDLLPKEWSDLYTVGRLDWESEGLIFLTNDGDFCLRLTHPRFEVRKKYWVTVEKRLAGATLEQFTRGVFHDGEKLKADRARLVQASNSRSLIEIDLHEGKNREIRRLCEALHLTVEKLQRVQIGPVKLGELPRGKWRVLRPEEVKSLTSAPKAGARKPRPSQ